MLSSGTETSGWVSSGTSAGVSGAGSAYTADSVRVFLEKLDVIEPFGNLAEVPETCEIAMRTKNEEKYLFILNYEKTPASVKFLKPMKDLWTDNTLIGEVELEPYGVLVAEVL